MSVFSDRRAKGLIFPLSHGRRKGRMGRSTSRNPEEYLGYPVTERGARGDLYNPRGAALEVPVIEFPAIVRPHGFGPTAGGDPVI